MPGGRDSEVIPGSLVVPGSTLESAMLAWLGSGVMGPSTVDVSTHTLSLCSWGTLGVFPVEKICPPIHTPDPYPIHTPIHTLLLPFAAKSLLRSGQYWQS